VRNECLRNYFIFFLSFFWGGDAFISLFQHTQTIHTKPKIPTQQYCYVLPKTYALAGFEPGSFVSQEDAISTAPRRQSIFEKLIFFTHGYTFEVKESEST
jgi:hypothetical protein